MILLQSIVEVAVGPVEHVTAQGLADGTRVGVMPIGRHPFWGVTNHIDGLLEKALSKLSETQKSLVMLKDYEGYSYEEIGKITGLNESQVKVYLHRARVQLKNYLVKPENVI